MITVESCTFTMPKSISFTFPDASILTDYMLGLLTKILRGMRVNAERMGRNLDASNGLYFSEKVLTALVEGGLSRPDAYKLVQRSAMQSWESNEPFRSVLDRDPEVARYLTREQLDALFDLESFLQHIDKAYRRSGLPVADEGS